MMGHREKLKGGDEYDALTVWRVWYSFRAGVRKRVKQKFNRRIRKQARQAAEKIN